MTNQSKHRIVEELPHNGFVCACGYRRESPGYLTREGAFQAHKGYAEKYLDGGRA